MKKCTKCGKVKDESEFHPAHHHSDDLASQCKLCKNKWTAAHYQRTKEKQHVRGKMYRDKNREVIREKANHMYKTDPRRKRAAWATHGIDMTVDRYNEMSLSQKGKCLICGVHQKDLKQKLSVDHNHATGEVRGLLCYRCNLMVGNVECNSDIIERVHLYIKNYEHTRTG